MKISEQAKWRQPLVEATLISVFVLGLFYYWFGLANRHAIFLYEHTAVGIPRAQPFDEMTSSRYWMAGLVAAGFVMVIYTAVAWLRTRIAARQQQHFVPTNWRRVWLLCAVPLAVGIPAITMTVNAPTLPLNLAAACVLATLLGLAVALLPAQWAVQRPLDLVWLIADGAGLIPALTVLRAIELPERGLISESMAWVFAIGGLLAGAIWLAGMSLLRRWRQKETPDAGKLFLAGLGLSYVLLPLIHYLLARPPGYRYISTASNFFAFNPALQLLAVLVAVGMAEVVTNVRHRWLDGHEWEKRR